MNIPIKQVKLSTQMSEAVSEIGSSTKRSDQWSKLLIDVGMNLQEAGDAPRIRHVSNQQPTGGEMFDGGELSLESGFDYEEIRRLMKYGHKVVFSLGSFGGYQAIMYDETLGVYFGASESRKDGSAMGY